MTPMALDVAIGLIIFLSTLVAYFRGLIKEVFLLLGLGLAFLASFKGGHLLVPEFNKWLGVEEGADKADKAIEKAELVLGLLSPPLAAKVFSYGGSFLVVFLMMTLLGWLLTSWIKESGLGIVDKLLGGTFGFLRGFLLIFLIYVPATYLIDQKKMPVWVKESKSAPILQSTLEWANKNVGLDKMIEDRGGGIAIKLNKVDFDKLGEDVTPVVDELKEKVEMEEKEIQKAPEEEIKPPQDQPAPVVDKTGNGDIQGETIPSLP